MSMDAVDDLHDAEDAWGVTVELLRELLAQSPPELDCDTPTPTAEWLERARQALLYHTNYCRPTCGAEGDPHTDECLDDTCGCPCGHVDALEAVFEARRRG